MRIEPVTAGDRAELLNAAVETGVFAPGEAQALLGGVLDGLDSASFPAGHQAALCREVAHVPAVGWCYFAPDDHAVGVWNLWWIGVSPKHQGSGAGAKLLQHAQEQVLAANGRVLIIETSDAAPLARARKFYANQGYAECGRVPDFYAAGEAKIIFARTLDPALGRAVEAPAASTAPAEH